jgi:hypothetical protein
MPEEPDNIVLVFLRWLDEKMDRLIADVQDLKQRMTAVEVQLAGQSGRIDRIEHRLDRIERRLELAPTT